MIKQCLKITSYLLLLIVLNGCSSGRYNKTQEHSSRFSPHIDQKDAVLIQNMVMSCQTMPPKLEKHNVHTIFVHPGLLWFNLGCDDSLAAESARILIKHGYASNSLQVCDRDADKIGKQMQKESGTRFIGLHYSLGGQPQLLSATLASAAEARRTTGKDLLYYPVLVDPFDIEDMNTQLDMDAPGLGQIFVVLSAEHSLLRPNITGVREDILGNPKVHMIYAEDFGEEWGHFDELESLLSDDTRNRFRDIFFLIAETVVNGQPAGEFEGRLALLKIKYALEDSRPVNIAWLQSAEELPCAQQASRIMAKTQTP